MANDTIKKILRGAMAGGAGSLRGSIAAAQAEEERKRQRNKDIRSLLLGDSQLATEELRREEIQAKLDAPAPEPKPLTESQILAREIEKAIVSEDWSTVERIKTVGKAPTGTGGGGKTAKKDPTIGPISAGGLIKGRKKASEEARTAFTGQLPGLLQSVGQNFRPDDLEAGQIPLGTQPEDAISQIFSQIPRTIAKPIDYWPDDPSVQVPNPELEKMIQLLEQAGPIPSVHEPENLGALQDSVIQAQGTQGVGSGNLGIAELLRDFDPNAISTSIRELLGLEKPKPKSLATKTGKKKKSLTKANRETLKSEGFSDEEIEEALSQQQ